jgi:AcrR family transcriptional regulator
MIRAAHELFVERGYSGTKMTDVATAAGVAVQTVYFRFHTKAELLQACYERAVLGEDRPLPPPEQDWYRSSITAGDGVTALRHFAEGNTAIVARVGLLDDVVRSALHEPEAVVVRAHNESLRRDGYRVICAQLSKRFGLRAHLTVEAATDILLAFGGTSLYRDLVLGYGWPLRRYVDWLARSLAEQLLSTPTTASERARH